MPPSRSRRRSGGTYVDGIGEIDLLVDQLRKVPKESKRTVRKAIVEATKGMRADMARRASWSDRIPGAIGVRASFARGAVEIRVNHHRAPHARPYEGIGTRGAGFRHPVFGHRDRKWAEQATRPFFFITVDAHRKKVIEAVEKAVFATLPR
jgi:hypothetical protein